MGEMQDFSQFAPVLPDRHDSCPMCGSDGKLESALIRVRNGILSYAAGFVYHCTICDTAWPMCEEYEKRPIEEWVKFNDIYEDLE